MSFTYSDKEWSAIAPSLSSIPFVEGQSAQIREFIEQLGEEMLSGTYESMLSILYALPGEKALIARLDRSALALNELLKKYSQLTTKFDLLKDLNSLEPQLSTKDLSQLLIQLILNLKKRSTFIKNHSGKIRSLERDFYFGRLLTVWRSLGGKFASSNDANGRATGPLVRYMLCTVTPVFQQAGRCPPTPDAIRYFARRAKADQVMFIPEQRVRQEPSWVSDPNLSIASWR